MAAKSRRPAEWLGLGMGHLSSEDSVDGSWQYLGIPPGGSSLLGGSYYPFHQDRGHREYG
jgi:hypothetical protein